MEGEKESKLTGYPDLFSYNCTKIILEQMEKHICKIKTEQNQGTGFFCKIPFPDKNSMLSVFITNNHIIDENMLNNEDEKIEIKIKEKEDYLKIYLKNRMNYTNKKFDITIIEIKEEDEIKNFLELDDYIIKDILYDDNKNVEYLYKTIYIIQYPKGELLVSYGILNGINEYERYDFIHLCNTEKGSSGSPVIYNNNKVIGIHKAGIANKNIQKNSGTFLNEPIKEFIKKNYKMKDKNYEINETYIKEFNKRYNKNFKYNDINIIDIREENLGNDGLKDFCNITLKNLKELNLEYNNISDIRALGKAKFNNLEILNLGKNIISNIDILEKVNFKELISLCLNANNITDIRILERVKFLKLKKLDLSFNKINNINILENVQFKELKELNLKENLIPNIDVLEKVDFKKLEILDLTNNKITNIDVLEKVNFKELKKLFLNQNNIKNINVLENVIFENIQILDFD